MNDFPRDDISILDIGNLSIIEILMLQMLSRQEKPIVRHLLYNELTSFLIAEKGSIVNSLEGRDFAKDDQRFQKHLASKKKLSSSSFYNSLENLERRGLVKFNLDAGEKVETVEATNFTGVLINTILKHFIKFGLIEVNHNRSLPEIISNACEDIDKVKCTTLLYVNFNSIIPPSYIKSLLKLTENLFILSEQAAFENISKNNEKNIESASLFKETIRDPENFYDVVIIPYKNENDNLKGVRRDQILKDAFRVIKEDGVVIIHGFMQPPNVDLGILNVFANWIQNNYTETVFYTIDDFQRELVKAGAKNTEVRIKSGILFGYGSKSSKSENDK